ncbi:hypothetical protein AWM70_02885 [Paenibacillus yonginensis]|uniref:Sporulation protein n=1 Tax=Paenibacillus yonginensis TaxID=1462996 RepID=A0A1B1MWT8_9BACL|nr:putative sporulation protein YtxC [Paenibacillus yonginensis]ANS73652.1 hypothetical protein AWM70_02885 [Paenibacillus yonginensis]
MQLFNLTTSVDSRRTAEQLCTLFEAEGEKLSHGRSNAVRFRYCYAHHRITVECISDQAAIPARTIKGLKAKAAEWMTEHVLRDKEPVLLRKLLGKYYSLHKHEDIPEIVSMAIQILDGLSEYEVHMKGRERRVAEIYTAILDGLVSTGTVDVDGWLSFRMPAYLDELKDALDLAVDEYVLDKQYEEFIGLLKYFVQFQDIRIPLIHLKHVEGMEFELLDDQMHPLGPLPYDDGITIKMADLELQMEDAVVSSLISLSPARIMIHTREPELRMIATIQEIFGERAQLCSD